MDAEEADAPRPRLALFVFYIMEVIPPAGAPVPDVALKPYAF